jgi:hypothetical protein
LGSVTTVGSTWLIALRQLDSALDASAPLLGADVAVRLKSDAKGITDSLATALGQLENDPKATFELLHAALSRLHTASSRRQNLFRRGDDTD